MCVPTSAAVRGTEHVRHTCSETAGKRRVSELRVSQERLTGACAAFFPPVRRLSPAALPRFVPQEMTSWSRLLLIRSVLGRGLNGRTGRRRLQENANTPGRRDTSEELEI